MNLPQGQELRAKHVGAIINRKFVQQVGIIYCICNTVVRKMCSIRVDIQGYSKRLSGF